MASTASTSIFALVEASFVLLAPGAPANFRIPPETGLLIPSVFATDCESACSPSYFRVKKKRYFLLFPNRSV